MTSPTGILLAVDSSPAASRALELVAGFSRAPRITALNVQSPPVMTAPEASLALEPIHRALEEAGQRISHDAVARLRAAGLEAEPVVKLGLPAGTIIEEAKARGTALVVMGTRGHGALRGFAFGSVALRVAHGSEAPVCLVHPDARLPKSPGGRLRVLLGVDGSAPPLRVAQALAGWQPWLGELDVQLAFVQAPLTVAEQILPPHNDVIEQWSTREGEEAAAPVREMLTARGIRHHLHLSVGDPAGELLLLADRLDCEMLALGTLGRGALHHALVGSVALKVAAASTLPVLLAR